MACAGVLFLHMELRQAHACLCVAGEVHCADAAGCPAHPLLLGARGGVRLPQPPHARPVQRQGLRAVPGSAPAGLRSHRPRLPSQVCAACFALSYPHPATACLKLLAVLCHMPLLPHVALSCMSDPNRESQAPFREFQAGFTPPAWLDPSPVCRCVAVQGGAGCVFVEIYSNDGRASAFTTIKACCHSMLFSRRSAVVCMA